MTALRRPPLAHCFETSTTHYIYDVPSNRIVRAAPAFWHDLRSVCELEWPPASRPDDGTRCLPAAAAEWIMRARSRDGLFQPLRPPECPVVLTGDDIGTRGSGSLLLHITNQCNMRCTYCVFSGQYEDRPSHSDERMAWPTAKAVLDFYLDSYELAQNLGNDPPIVSFIGGEPLLDLALIRRCVDYARARCPDVKFAITTNGTLLTREAADFLTGHDFVVSVSLDGPREVHDAGRVFADGHGSFAHVVANLNALNRASPTYYQQRLKLQLVVQDSADLPVIADFFEGHDLTPANPMHVRLARVMRADARSRQEDGAQFDREAVVLAVPRYGAFAVPLSIAIRTGWALLRQGVVQVYRRPLAVPRQDTDWLHAGPCIPGTVRLYVTPDGRFYPCQKVRTHPALEIGSVDRGLSPGTLAQFLNTFYTITGDLCSECWAVRLCTLCPAMVSTQEMLGDRSDMEGIRNRCERIRNSLDYYLTLMCEILERNPRALDEPAAAP